jgi:hypothetical protein
MLAIGARRTNEQGAAVRRPQGITMFVALSAFVVTFVLFMPFVCSTAASESLRRSPESHTSCATLLGLSLPGFSGEANFSPSYAAPILSGAIAALAVIGCSMIWPARRDVGRHDEGPDV